VSPPKCVFAFLCFFVCVLSSLLVFRVDVRLVQVEKVE